MNDAILALGVIAAFIVVMVAIMCVCTRFWLCCPWNRIDAATRRRAVQLTPQQEEELRVQRVRESKARREQRDRAAAERARAEHRRRMEVQRRIRAQELQRLERAEKRARAQAMRYERSLLRAQRVRSPEVDQRIRMLQQRARAQRRQEVPRAPTARHAATLDRFRMSTPDIEANIRPPPTAPTATNIRPPPTAPTATSIHPPPTAPTATFDAEAIREGITASFHEFCLQQKLLMVIDESDFQDDEHTNENAITLKTFSDDDDEKEEYPTKDKAATDDAVPSKKDKPKGPRPIRIKNRRSPQPDVIASNCPICLESFEVGDGLLFSNNPSCEHIFHEECMTEFLVAFEIDQERNGRQDGDIAAPCPCCRRDFMIRDA